MNIIIINIYKQHIHTIKTRLFNALRVIVILCVLGIGNDVCAQPFTVAIERGITTLSPVTACASNYTFSFLTNTDYGHCVYIYDNGVPVSSGWGTFTGLGFSYLNWNPGVVGINNGTPQNTTVYCLITTSPTKTMTFSTTAPTCGPIITVTPTSLSGFSACTTSPSVSQTFTVSGASLTSDIVITAPSGYELSTNGTTYSGSLSLTPTGGAVASTTIYVRLASGGSVGTYNGNIACTSTGATTKNVAVTGTVTNTASMTLSTTSITGLNYTFGSGPSVAQSFTVTGLCLSGNISITAPANFEVSITSATTGFANSVNLTSIGGTVWVRLIAGLAINSYSGNVSVANSTSGITSPQTVSLSGSVTVTPRNMYYSGTGNWSDLSRWRLGSCSGSVPTSLPTIYDNVFMCTDANLTVNIDAECNSFTATGTRPTLTLNATKTLTVAGDFNTTNASDGGGFAINGTLNVSGNMTWGISNQRTLTIATTGSVVVNGNFTINNKDSRVTVDGLLWVKGILTDNHTNNNGLGGTTGTGTVKIDGNFVYTANNTWQNGNFTLDMSGGCGQTITINRALTIAKLIQSATCNTDYTVTNPSVILTTNVYDQNCNIWGRDMRPVDGGAVGSGFSVKAAINAVCTPLITVSTTSLPTFTVCQGATVTPSTFTVAGSSLTSNIVLTPPAGFEISLTSGSGYVSTPSTLTLTPSSQVVPITTIYVRPLTVSSGTPSGDITITSTGATSKTVSLSATINSLPSLYTILANDYCENTAGGAISLSGSDVGISYQLVFDYDEIPVGSPVSGTGSSISFGLQTEGIYRVIASSAYCSRTMGPEEVEILPLPDAIEIFHY